ncbi:probable calcium-binding protein CML35 [Brachypodium distachyon]|nr:probable calcium-binding protein CML35 [Brachypodium distachyon]|eukprot:XP_003565061.4 probable calcium-binding protein CML35 [Brachypodium distachyon]
MIISRAYKMDKIRATRERKILANAKMPTESSRTGRDGTTRTQQAENSLVLHEGSFREAHFLLPYLSSPRLLLLLSISPSTSRSVLLSCKCSLCAIVRCLFEVEMKLSIQSLARKLSPKRSGSGKKKGGGVGISRSEAPSFASSSSSEEASSAAAPSPRSVLLPPPAPAAVAEISRRELEAVLRRLGHGEPSDDELDAVAAMAASGDAAGADSEEELMDAFRVFDADGDGRIDAEELRAVMAAILGDGGAGCSLDDCRRMIGGVDADGDGFVGFQDFSRMMMMSSSSSSSSSS